MQEYQPAPGVLSIQHQYLPEELIERAAMFEFVTSLFGCSHRHCTFPITARKQGAANSDGTRPAITYIVCLDCGKEFPYDWQKMKVVSQTKRAA